jgi:hypothetical protein
MLDDAAFGAASPVTPKFISRSDPAAQWTGAHKGHAFFAYAANYLIDTDHGVIVDVEATRAIRQAEVGAARTMLERTETRFGIKPVSLTADSAYGSADSLARLVKEKDIAPHIPVFDKSNRTDGILPRRLRLRSRTRPLHVPGGQRACPIPTHLRHSQKRRHSRGHKTLSRQQIGLRHLQTQTTVLPERSCPQDPAGSARRRPRRGPCARRNSAIRGGLTEADCDAYTAARRARGRSDSTIWTELGRLRSALKWAENKRLIDRAPKVYRPAQSPPRDLRMTNEQVKTFIAACTLPHLKLFAVLAATTGARMARSCLLRGTVSTSSAD